eukprot:NODE_4945_length_1827_cov_14.175882.p1 GENE.NODE_4945_length_1827_cov_14.175882~~NODE_4945_length_1827_cov_14.175882.p1  ORF type:complete len:369 (-),score=68.96 NODE_4945_length_1827_cov_14.175882:587-1693(-)
MVVGSNEPAYASLARSTGQEPEVSGDEIDEEGDDVDLPEDMYGAVMYSAIFDFFEILTGRNHNGLDLRLNILRLSFVVLILTVNYLLQLGLLYWIYVYVVGPSVHLAQRIYRDYHREIYTKEGQFIWEAWEEWDHYSKSEVCGIAFGSYFFMFAIQWLWVVTMVNENNKTEQLLADIRAVAITTDANQMIDSEESDGKVRVKRLTPFVRFFLIAIVIIPKFVVGFSLLVVGVTWLTATDDFSDLILNAIALEFVVGIDNLLYEAMLPKSVVQAIQNTKLFIRAKKQTKREKEADVLWHFVKSTGWVVFSVATVYLFLGHGQYIPYAGVFPGYAHDTACPIFNAKMSKRLCTSDKDCFPYGHHHSNSSN